MKKMNAENISFVSFDWTVQHVFWKFIIKNVNYKLTEKGANYIDWFAGVCMCITKNKNYLKCSIDAFNEIMCYCFYTISV